MLTETETPLYSGPVESGTKADDISNSDELTLKQTKGRSKRPVKSTATKKAASHKADRLWEVDTVVTDSNSPLTNINLHVSNKLLRYIVYQADIFLGRSYERRSVDIAFT